MCASDDANFIRIYIFLNIIEIKMWGSVNYMRSSIALTKLKPLTDKSQQQKNNTCEMITSWLRKSRFLLVKLELQEPIKQADMIWLRISQINLCVYS